MKRICIFLLALLSMYTITLAQNQYWSKPSPYEISWKKDLIIGGLSAGTFIVGVQIERNEDLPDFEPGSFNQTDIDQINAFDRGFAGRWDVDAKDAGKIFKFTASRLVPLGLLAMPGSLKSRASLGLIFVEGYFLNAGLTTLSKGLTDRYRPYTYLTLEQIDQLQGEAREEFLEDIADDDIEDSFYSGDAATTAYGLIFFAKVFNDYFPESKLRYGVWGASILGTGLGAYFRAKSGKHFPSDVIVGSLVGGTLGYLIPQLHKRKEGRRLSINPGSNGLSLTYSLR